MMTTIIIMAMAFSKDNHANYVGHDYGNDVGSNDVNVVDIDKGNNECTDGYIISVSLAMMCLTRMWATVIVVVVTF